jgi:DNA helicase II / ATP-dependent DNA helicase PcrA
MRGVAPTALMQIDAGAATRIMCRTLLAATAWWRRHYLQPSTPHVDFVMLNRLAELLLRAVPALRRALRITYPFVFVDEFQDTTRAQFSFLTSVFGAGPVVTVVGDSK